MARLTAAVLMVALAPVPAEAAPVRRWSTEIAEASRLYGIPADWIRRVIALESSGRNRIGDRPTVSRSGALGLMQLMPGTWLEMRALAHLGSNPHDPRDNILAGSLYLRLMYDRFGYPGLFAAYNAGPVRYGAFLSGERSLPAETRAYLKSAQGHGRTPSVTNGPVAAVSPSAGSLRPQVLKAGEFRAKPLHIFVTLSGDSAARNECRDSSPKPAPEILAVEVAQSCGRVSPFR